MRAVVDPNVLISGLIAPGGVSARVLVAWREGLFELVTSPSLVSELTTVLRREKFRPYLTIADVDAFLELVRRESTHFEDPPASAETWSEDPGDEYLISLASAAAANALVSGDPHLTRLRDRIPVRTPRDFLDLLEHGSL